VETNHDVLQHLESCPDCRADIGRRREMRDQLRRAFDAADPLRPRPEFAAELAAALRPALAQPSRRSVLRSWWAVAAGLAAAAGGGLVFRQQRERSRLAALARIAAGDHQNCALTFRLSEHPLPMDEAGRRFGLPYRALTTFVPPMPDGPVQVLDRHACVYDSHRFAHVVFRHGSAPPISLLVLAAPPPSSVTLEPTVDDTTVISLPAGRYLGFVVTTHGNADALLGLAAACSGELASRLA
jgi:hypothetical protein